MKKCIWILPVLIVACLSGLGVMVAFCVLAEKILAPVDYLFFEHQPMAEMGLVWLLMLPVILGCCLLAAKLLNKTQEQMEDIHDIIFIWNHLGKWRLAAVIVWVLALYCCFTSAAVVTKENIISYSPLHPSGIVYNYEDVENITAGFGNKVFTVLEYQKKGNFFYQIQIDGKKIVFHIPNVNEEIERYEEDSYLELEEFDRILVKLGIPKTADETGYENCDLDQQYVNRFLRIIRLK